MRVVDIKVRKILSSTGSETVEVEMKGEGGKQARSSVPAGISAGKYEVLKVGADEAVMQIEGVKELVLGRDFNQQTLDEALAGQEMGGNASLAVSAAFWESSRAGQIRSYEKFPKLFLLVFEGGEHGNKNIAMQEFCVVEESLEMAITDYRKMKKHLEAQGVETLVGAEGAFSPKEFDDLKVLATMSEVFPGQEMALDAAGSFKDSNVNYEGILKKFKVVSIEDPYSDEQWKEWKEFYDKYGSSVMVVGDDLTVTNVERMRQALEPRVINAVVVKPNQVGTISKARQAVELARRSDLKVVVSHRGEETDDDWIVDFALEVEADYVKFGGIERGERVAKYNRLRELGMR